MFPTVRDATNTPIASEACLFEFCHAALELLRAGNAERSLLGEILPSFAGALRVSDESVRTLQAEFDDWRRRSEQLMRLASLHCNDDSQAMIRSLREAGRKALRAVDALAALHASPPGAGGDSGDLASAEEIRLADDAGSRRVSNREDRPLWDFCEAAIDLLGAGPENRSILSQTIPSLISALRCDRSEAMVRLRGELRTSETAAEQLMPLAAAHFGANAEGLKRSVKRSHLQAARLIDALQSLQQAPERGVASAVEYAATGPAETLASAQPDAPRAVIETRDVGRFPSADCESAKELFQLARQRQQAREFEAAEDLYTQSLGFDESLQPAFVFRGYVRLLQGKLQPALADLAQALGLNAQDALAIRIRGDAFAQLDRFESAIADYDRFLELHADDINVRYNRAVVMRKAGRIDDAWSELEDLVRRDPSRAPFYLNRGMICLTRGDREEAAHEFRTALSLQPNSQEAIQYLEALKPETAGRQRELGALDGSRLASPASRRDDQADEGQPACNAAMMDNVYDLDERPASSSRLAAASRSAPVSSPSPAARPASRPKRPAASLGKSIAELSRMAGILKVPCPECGVENSVPWDRLQTGTVFGCPHCGSTIAPQANGEFALVRQNRTGKWAVQHERRSVSRSLIAAGIAGVIVAASLQIALYSVLIKPAPVAEVTLPIELEPRTKLFGEAWLKKDYRLIRRLTLPEQSPSLFAWHKKNPTPASDENVKIEVVVIKDPPPVAVLNLRFDGLPSPNPTRELSLAWIDKDGEWMFLPNPNRVGRDSNRVRRSADIPPHQGPLDTRGASIALAINLNRRICR